MMRILGTFLILLVIVSCNNSSSKENNVGIPQWILQNSQSVETIEITEKQDDISQLKKIVGDADLVCLGESRHDIHEQFKLKHRFIKYLVEIMHFKTFVLEASLPYSNKINDYILNGKGNIDQLMINMPAWFIWNTQEMKDILIYLREYNNRQQEGDKVNFYGIDIVAPKDGLDQIFKYLQKVDKNYYEEVKSYDLARNLINDKQWQSSLKNFLRQSIEKRHVLRKQYKNIYTYIKERGDTYTAKSSAKEYQWILQLSYSASEAINMFTETDKMKMGLIRENAMANNSLWIKERNDKVILWAHNVHIAKSEFKMSMFPDTPIQGMGYILNKALKGKMISIGASFSEGEFPDESIIFRPANKKSIDGTLAGTNMKYFLLNLKAKTDNKIVEEWLNKENTMRAQGFEMICVVKNTFDAIFFTKKISKVNLCRTKQKQWE